MHLPDGSPPHASAPPTTEFQHLEFLAELDALAVEVRAAAALGRSWQTGRQIAALLERLQARTATLRVRWEAPLVVALLGGTGVGKSTLVNALVGREVTPAGQQRPTTLQPVLICRPGLTPAALGLDAPLVRVQAVDSPNLRELVLIDCPDPDTTEDPGQSGTNLARLRALLPHCDVLLVATTQQKYRSARVQTELLEAAPGAALVWVQTHADREDDIRSDWRQQLAPHFTTERMFFVDAPAALAAQQAGQPPRGEFAQLQRLLSCELAGAAARRVRRSNFLDLLDQAVAACLGMIERAQPALAALEESVQAQRQRLAQDLAQDVQAELLRARRLWEQRVLTEVAGQWGFSPWSAVLRCYLGLGELLSGWGMFRARTPAQMALWGVATGVQRYRRKSALAGAARSIETLPAAWDEGELRTAGLIVAGYAQEADLDADPAEQRVLQQQAGRAAQELVQRAARDVQETVVRQARRQGGWFTRLTYESLWALCAGGLAYRFGRNFLYDSWLAVELGRRSEPAPLLGLEFLASSALVLALWSGGLLWLFLRRLRRGLGGELQSLSRQWQSPAAVGALWENLDDGRRQVLRQKSALERLSQKTHYLRSAQPAAGDRWRGAVASAPAAAKLGPS